MATPNKKSDSTDQPNIGALLEEFLTNNSTLKELKGLTDKEMEAVYTAAFNYYSHDKFKEAHELFTALCQFDHQQFKYWMGLGASRQMLKQHEGAVEAYGMAALIDNANPKVPFHAADCLLALKDYERAKQALEAAIFISKALKKHKDIQSEAESLLEMIDAKLKKGA